MKVTPSELADILNGLDLDFILEKAAVVFANEITANMQERIHVKAENSDGEPMYYRSTDYKNLRAELGFRTDRKDLEREGDLRRSLQSVNLGSQIGVRIVGDEFKKIAERQESIEGSEIYRPQQKNLDIAAKKAENSVLKELKKQL